LWEEPKILSVIVETSSGLSRIVDKGHGVRLAWTMPVVFAQFLQTGWLSAATLQDGVGYPQEGSEAS